MSLGFEPEEFALPLWSMATAMIQYRETVNLMLYEHFLLSENAIYNITGFPAQTCEDLLPKDLLLIVYTIDLYTVYRSLQVLYIVSGSRNC